MTPQEIETLHLKGMLASGSSRSMTAPRTASERNKAKCDHNEMARGEKHSEAIKNGIAKSKQGATSPLPWRTLENYKGGIPLSIQSDENTSVARVDWLPDGSGRASEKCKANAKLIVRAVNHASNLAKVLERTLDIMTGDQAAELGIYDALAAYEAAQ